jgi:putative DNA primase/helicase
MSPPLDAPNASRRERIPPPGPNWSLAPPTPEELSEDALAIRFSERHDGAMLYVPAWGQWLRWDGTRWAEDELLHVYDAIRVICREAATEALTLNKNGDRLARDLRSAKTVSAVEKLARSDRRHVRPSSVFDADPWLLNTPTGVVDLRDGSIREHRPSDHLTKMTAVGPGEGCPLWRRFLDQITAGDQELQAFLQRVAGYSLTGITREHALFFAYGTGGNGKGTFMNTWTWILGDYAKVATMETFTASNSDRHPSDIAMLRGARFVASQETEKGRQWAQSRIQALTGGDPIRRQRGDPAPVQPDPVHRHHPRQREGQKPLRQAAGGGGRHPGLGDRGVSAVAAGRLASARRCHCCNR